MNMIYNIILLYTVWMPWAHFSKWNLNMKQTEMKETDRLELWETTRHSHVEFVFCQLSRLCLIPAARRWKANIAVAKSTNNGQCQYIDNTDSIQIAIENKFTKIQIHNLLAAAGLSSCWAALPPRATRHERWMVFVHVTGWRDGTLSYFLHISNGLFIVAW